MPAETKSSESTKATATSSSVFLRAVILLGVILLFAVGAFYLSRPKETPFTRSVAQIKHGKAAKAIPVLEKIIRDYPDTPEVYPWLAQAYLATERYAEGRTALDTSLRLNLPAKHLFPVITAYAQYYIQRGDFDEAEKLYLSSNKIGQAKHFDSDRAKMYLLWADKNIVNGIYKDAIHHLQLADSLSSGLKERERKSIPHLLSDCYRKLAAIAEMEEHNDKEAIKLLEKSISVHDEPITRVALATIFTRLGKTQKAVEQYQAVAQADPNNLEVRHHLIELLLETNDYEKAQDALAELTDKEKSVENFELLADLNLKTGNYAGAVRALEEASGLRATPEILEKLRDTLLSWRELLLSEKKIQEAISVKGHAERVSEQLALIDPDRENKDKLSKQKQWDPASCPVAIVFSRNWLEKGSYTPEGKIKIRNISGSPVKSLALTVVFYDNTSRKRIGKIDQTVATSAKPYPPGTDKWIYFTWPRTVSRNHQLAVIILWKGRFLKEFPVVKRHR